MIDKILVDGMILQFHEKWNGAKYCPTNNLHVYHKSGKGLGCLQLRINGVDHIMPMAGILNVKDLPETFEYNFQDSGMMLIEDETTIDLINNIINNNDRTK